MTPRPSRGPLASKSATRWLSRRFVVALGLVAALVWPPAMQAADGDRDVTFGFPFGDVQLGLPPLVTGVSRGFAVRAQPDGRILVLAEYQTALFAPPTALLLHRLLPNGDPDPSFGPNGIEILEIYPGTPIRGRQLELLEDGKILVGADVEPVFGSRWWAVGRRLPDGDPDTGFGSNGWAEVQFPTIGFDSRLYALAVGDDGRIVAAGETYLSPDNSVATFARLTAAGALDPTFGAGGRSSADLGNPALQENHTRALDALVEPGGSSVVFSGETRTYDPSTGTFWRAVTGRLVDGIFDPGFNGTGYRLDDFAPLGARFFQSLPSVSRRSDGSYLTVGNYRTYPALDDLSTMLQVLPNGTLDVTWGFSGYSWFVFDLAGTESLVRRCDLDVAERTVCFGAVTNDFGRQVALSRFEGPWFDTRFGSSGTARYSWPQPAQPEDVAFDPNGRILTVGTMGNSLWTVPVVMRVLAGLPFADGFESGLLEAWSATNP